LALREVRTFLDRQPFRAESWRMLGEALEKIGDVSRAREAFAEAARRDVHDAVSRKGAEE
jgi:cytochrome c-type biogenesis protein CcmH/NrfG